VTSVSWSEHDHLATWPHLRAGNSVVCPVFERIAVSDQRPSDPLVNRPLKERARSLVFQ
jgi:hypothetical protein